MRAFRAAAASAALMAAYSFYEPRRFRLSSRVVPVRRGAPRLTILHVSDLHMRARDRSLARFMARLPEAVGEVPDIVIATGDLIDNDGGIGPAVEALGGLEAKAGKFYVLGSHDYYQAVFQTYTKYFTRDAPSRRPVPADTDALEAGLRERGWVSLSNLTEHVVAGGGRVRLSGVDDPYIHRHRTDHVVTEAEDALAIGVMHAPDLVSEFALRGFDLLLAGHTHAGQVRVPGVGALVTNCKLPVELAGGLSRIGSTWLHVSPGLGQGTFSPIRFNARPEATLLRLEPGAH